MNKHVIWQTQQSCKIWNVPKDERITSIKTRYIEDKTFLIVSVIFHTQHSTFIIGRKNILSRESEGKIKEKEWQLGKNDNFLGFVTTREITERQRRITSLGFVYDKCAPEIIRKARNRQPMMIHNPSDIAAQKEVTGEGSVIEVE